MIPALLTRVCSPPHLSVTSLTTSFTRALSVTRNNAVAHNALGLELYKNGRLEEAIEHYREAIEISPIYMDARVNVAAALMKTGRTEEAMQHYRAAMRLSPGEALIPMKWSSGAT